MLTPAGVLYCICTHAPRLFPKGLYTARSNNTCGGYAASCMHEQVDALQYAAWGVDYLKDDSCGECRSDGGAMVDYSEMQKAIYATNRSIYLSIEGFEDVAKVSLGGHGKYQYSQPNAHTRHSPFSLSSVRRSRPCLSVCLLTLPPPHLSCDDAIHACESH